MPEVQDDQGKTQTVSDQELSEQFAAESQKTIRTPRQAFVARNMTPSRLGSFLRGAANWDPGPLMEFAMEVEERDPHYRSVLQTRKMSIRQLDWDVEPASESTQDKTIAAFVKEVLGRKGFNSMLGDCLDGISKGYAAVEMIWGRVDTMPGRLIPTEYIWRDPRYFGFDFETQSKLQLLTDKEPTYGEPLPPAKFLVHLPQLKSGKIARSGLIFTVAALYLMKAYVTKDWLAFSEVFGMPMRMAKVAEGATEEDKKKIFQALASLGSDGTAIFGTNVQVEFMSANALNHGDFYESGVRFWNQEISKVTLGQTMTTEDGSSQAQAKVHEGVRTDIRNADALALAETLNDDLIAPLVQLNFGPAAAVPKFGFDTTEEEDVKLLAEALVPFIKLGLPVSHDSIRQKFGLVAPAEGEEVFTMAAPVVPGFPGGDGDASVDLDLDEADEGGDGDGDD